MTSSWTGAEESNSEEMNPLTVDVCAGSLESGFDVSFMRREKSIFQSARAAGSNAPITSAAQATNLMKLIARVKIRVLTSHLHCQITKGLVIEAGQFRH